MNVTFSCKVLSRWAQLVSVFSRMFKFSRIVIYRAKSRRSGLEWGDLPILFSRNNCSLSVGVFSFSLIWESIAAQFLTFVPHGEQTLVEKDSPSSRTTKSSFFSRSANFGNVSPFLVGATNTFSELIHPLIKLPNWSSTIYPKRSALSAYSPFEEQAQALLAYSHFHSLLILHFIYYISQRSNAKNCFRIMQNQDSKPSADNNTRYSPSKSITECIKFTKRAELWTDFWQLDDIFELLTHSKCRFF